MHPHPGLPTLAPHSHGEGARAAATTEVRPTPAFLSVIAATALAVDAVVMSGLLAAGIAVAACTVGALINFAIAFFLAAVADLPLAIADTVGIAVATVWNYLLVSRFVWRDSRMPDGDPPPTDP